MTAILVSLSSVRLHAEACGLKIKVVPRSVFLAVCYRGSPLFVAGAYHTHIKKKSRFSFFILGDRTKKKKNAPPAQPRVGADLPSTAGPHATERRQPTTQYLPTYDKPLLRRFSPFCRQHHKPTRILPSTVVALYLLQEQNKAPNVFVCTGRDHLPRAVPAGTSNVPTVPR